MRTIKKKIPREPSKRELETMLQQIDAEDSIAVFNARKSLYIYIDKYCLIDTIKQYLNEKLEEFEDETNLQSNR